MPTLAVQSFVAPANATGYSPIGEYSSVPIPAPTGNQQILGWAIGLNGFNLVFNAENSLSPSSKVGQMQVGFTSQLTWSGGSPCISLQSFALISDSNGHNMGWPSYAPPCVACGTVMVLYGTIEEQATNALFNLYSLTSGQSSGVLGTNGNTNNFTGISGFNLIASPPDIIDSCTLQAQTVQSGQTISTTPSVGLSINTPTATMDIIMGSFGGAACVIPLSGSLSFNSDAAGMTGTVSATFTVPQGAVSFAPDSFGIIIESLVLNYADGAAEILVLGAMPWGPPSINQNTSAGTVTASWTYGINIYSPELFNSGHINTNSSFSGWAVWGAFGTPSAI